MEFEELLLVGFIFGIAQLFSDSVFGFEVLCCCVVVVHVFALFFSFLSFFVLGKKFFF